MHLLNWILVFKRLLYHKLHPISSVEKLKVCNYPLVKRLVYRGAIWRKELNMCILKRAVFKDCLNSCFVGTEAINQEEHLPVRHPFVKSGKPIKHNNCCHPGLLIVPPDNIQ